MNDEILTSLIKSFPYGSHWMNANDGFKGTVVGWYYTREGKAGVSLQLNSTKVVHIYNSKWLDPC